jgi:hypothetical protein
MSAITGRTRTGVQAFRPFTSGTSGIKTGNFFDHPIRTAGGAMNFNHSCAAQFFKIMAATFTSKLVNRHFCHLFEKLN